MTSPHRPVARFALVALAAISLAACASHPKPLPLAPTRGPPPPPPPPPYARTMPAPPRGEISQSEETGAPVPGSVRDFVINAGDRVYFDFDRYALRDDARPILDAQSSWLGRYQGVHVRIEGNCDELGTREYNLALGARRANTVREYLIAHGVSAGRIETVSYGKERPIDAGGGEDAQAHNRNAHTAITEGAR